MNSLVIYKSKYGSAEAYAKLLAQDLGADLLKAEKVKPEDLSRYDAIIYGGGIYVGSVNGVSLLKKNWEIIKDKKIYLFTVGSAEVRAPETAKAILEGLRQKLPPEILDKLKIYHFQGGMQYSKMSFLHRMMMKMLITAMRKKPENQRLDHEKHMIESYGKDVTVTDRTAVNDFVQNFNQTTA